MLLVVLSCGPLCCLCCVTQMIYVLVVEEVEEDTTLPSFISCVTTITLELFEVPPPTTRLWRGTVLALNISIMLQYNALSH